MRVSKLQISAIIAFTIIGMVLFQTQGTNAAAPLFGGVKKLQVNVKLHSVDSEAKNLLVKAEFQGKVQSEEVIMNGSGYQTVSVVFPLLHYGLVDYYTAYVKNKDTDEENCASTLWWDHNAPSDMDLEVYNTR